MIRSLVFISFLFFTTFGSGWGQVESSISTLKEHYLIGDQISLDFVLEVEEGVTLHDLDLNNLDSIVSAVGSRDSLGNLVYPKADVSFLDYGFWQTNNNELVPAKSEYWEVLQIGNKKTFKNQVVLSFWDPGTYKIQDIKYVFDAGDGKQIYYSEDEIELIITAPGNMEEMSTDSLDIAPIKDILQEPSQWQDYLPYGYTLLSLILIGLLIYYLSNLKKDKKEPEVIEPPKPAHEIALQKLAELEQEKLWQKGEVKVYQSQLTYVIREYLENRYEIHALEMTTDQIVKQLRQKDFEMKWKDALKHILQIADLVKFAKAKPPLEINKEFLNEAFAFVENTKLMPSDNELQIGT